MKWRKTLLSSLLLLTFVCRPSFAWDGYRSIIDGVSKDKTRIIEFHDQDSTTAPVSATAKAHLIYDDTLGNLYASFNGGAYSVIGGDVPDSATPTGAWDFGGATSVEIPNGTNPTTNAEGEVAYDTDDDAIEVYDGSTSRLIPSTKFFHATIYDPDTIQAVEDAVPVLMVEVEAFPHGITLLDLFIKTDASSTYSVNFEEWTSPTDGTPSTIETVATSASTEASDDGTLTDASIASGSIIYIDLPATDIDMLQVGGTFYVNEGN